MLSLGWARGLRHYRSIALLGWPLLPRGNSASKFQGLEVLSLQDSLWATPTKEYKMTPSRILRPTHGFLQTHLQEPEILFLVHEWCVSKETHLIISRLLREFLQGDLRAKVVPEMGLLIAFLEESRMSRGSGGKMTIFSNGSFDQCKYPDLLIYTPILCI